MISELMERQANNDLRYWREKAAYTALSERQEPQEAARGEQVSLRDEPKNLFFARKGEECIVDLYRQNLN